LPDLAPYLFIIFFQGFSRSDNSTSQSTGCKALIMHDGCLCLQVCSLIQSKWNGKQVLVVLSTLTISGKVLIELGANVKHRPDMAVMLLYFPNGWICV
ncbi:unnamed protein product, partial [Urochloa humidicola]